MIFGIDIGFLHSIYIQFLNKSCNVDNFVVAEIRISYDVRQNCCHAAVDNSYGDIEYCIPLLLTAVASLQYFTKFCRKISEEGGSNS